MSVIYDTNNSNYEKGFAIGYENIRVMYNEKGAIQTFKYLEVVDEDSRNNPNDTYKKGYLDGCVKAFKNMHERS